MLWCFGLNQNWKGRMVLRWCEEASNLTSVSSVAVAQWLRSSALPWFDCAFCCDFWLCFGSYFGVEGGRWLAVGGCRERFDSICLSKTSANAPIEMWNHLTQHGTRVSKSWGWVVVGWVLSWQWVVDCVRLVLFNVANNKSAVAYGLQVAQA